MSDRTMGRGQTATIDMKARIAVLKAHGLGIDEIVTVLWQRCKRAEQGAGYRYEFATPDPVRSDGQLRQLAGR